MALFLPSGTMCNEIAIRLHIRPGGERMFIGRETHTLIAEAGGPAQLSGAVITEVDGDNGRFTPQALEHAIHGSGPGGRYGPRERLVSVEQLRGLLDGHQALARPVPPAGPGAVDGVLERLAA